MQKNTTNESFIKKHKILFFGIIVFAVGITFYAVSWSFLSQMSLCENFTGKQFMPNAIITETCEVVGDVGQDLSLRIVFYPNGGVEPIQIPSHLKITDPNGDILYDMNFDDKTIISFKPKVLGVYTVTIASLEDENNRIHRGYTDIFYGFGFLTSHDDVYNPLGNSFVWMAPIGNVMFLLGVAIMIYGGIKARKKS